MTLNTSPVLIRDLYDSPVCEFFSGRAYIHTPHAYIHTYAYTYTQLDPID